MLKAYDADTTFDADTAQEDVPNTEPVNEFAVIVPPTTVNFDPSNVNLSAPDIVFVVSVPIITRVAALFVTIAFPIDNDDVAAYEAETTLLAQEDVPVKLPVNDVAAKTFVDELYVKPPSVLAPCVPVCPVANNTHVVVSAPASVTPMFVALVALVALTAFVELTAYEEEIVYDELNEYDDVAAYEEDNVFNAYDELKEYDAEIALLVDDANDADITYEEVIANTELTAFDAELAYEAEVTVPAACAYEEEFAYEADITFDADTEYEADITVPAV